MCIFTNNVKFKIADQDIVCYKVLLKSNVEGAFLSPYLRFYCTLDKRYDDDNELDIHKWDKSDFTIDKGVFHMFANYEDAMDELDWLAFPGWLTFPENIQAQYICVIVKCIIPEGSEYIEGKYIDFHSIASKSVIYKEVLYESSPEL